MNPATPLPAAKHLFPFFWVILLMASPCLSGQEDLPHLMEKGKRIQLVVEGEPYLILGGEQSGHIIFRHHATTGDGVLTGLQLLDTVAGMEPSLEATLDGIEPCPQILINVRVKQKPDLKRHPTLGPAVAEAETALRETGRIVLRYSGTEPVARVMVEDTDAKAAREHAERLAQLIGDELGD